MGNDNFEVQRRRKGTPPTERAQAPQRRTGNQPPPPGGGSGGFPPSGRNFSTRGRQAGGCGSIFILLIFVAFYIFSNGQVDLTGGGFDQPSQPINQDPFVQQPQQFNEPPVSNFVPPVPASGDGQTWTVMLYQDADDKILEKDIFVDLNEAERVGSSDRVQIVAQIDRFSGAFQGDGDWTGTRRYYITQDNDLNALHSQVVQDLGEVNMADGQSLVDFVQWAAQNFPADKYILILSDHGMGWPGGWSDPSHSGNDSSSAPMVSRLGNQMYLMELDQALQQSREAAGIDQFEIIGMDACLMAQLEVMTALQPHGRYAVASEETEPSLGWAYASFLGDLVTDPDMDGEELTQRIVASYIEDDQRITDPAARADFMQGGSPLSALFGSAPASPDQIIAQMKQGSTISSVDLAQLPNLMQSMNNFAYVLQSEDQRLVAEARNYTQSYTSIFGQQVPPSYIDIGHFAALIANNTSSGSVKQAASDLFTTLQNTIVAERHGAGKKGSTGLAIYFPNSQLYGNPLTGPQSYNAIASRFASASLWDDFLAYHYAGRDFSTQTGTPFTPGNGFSVRAPGIGDISISEITKSSDVAAPNQPVRLSMDVSGENVGYVYLFVGYYDPGSNSVAVLDTDYLESPNTQEINGVYYPVWSNDFTLSFEWDPVVFAVNDGTGNTTALFNPQSYGATFEETVYAVDGVYTFADGGESVTAQLLFQNGNLVQIFGSTGSNDVGAPREITPQPGDTFNILQKWIETDASGAAQSTFEDGGAITFGSDPITWQQLFAAEGDYVVGFIIEDLDGNQYPVYTQVTVQ